MISPYLINAHAIGTSASSRLALSLKLTHLVPPLRPPDMKMDLEQDPEFVAFMKNNNLNSEAIEYLKSKLLPGHEEMLETISSAATLVIRKAQQDALSGIVYEDENKPPASVFKAAGCADKEHAPSTVAKSSSNVSAGSHVGTKKKMVRAVGDRPVGWDGIHYLCSSYRAA